MYKRVLLGVIGTACICGAVAAQSGPSSKDGKLAFLLPNLYGSSGLTLPNAFHTAHFDSAFQESFGPVNTAIAGQLVAPQIPSPAAGFVFRFDEELGVPTRSEESYGPILAERAETLGKDRFYFGISYQNFSFDTMDGINLQQFPAVFEHSDEPGEFDFERDVITTTNFYDIRYEQVIAFFTYGLTDRLDISATVPVVTASLDIVSEATIQRVGTPGNSDIHSFNDDNGNPSARQRFESAGSASGIGDVAFRIKALAIDQPVFKLALGLDTRLPTGDEFNFLGSGALGAKPFVAMSFDFQSDDESFVSRVSPHINAGYQWNDFSVLAGDVVTATKKDVPDQVTYAGGLDVGFTDSFTVAVDVFGQVILDAERMRSTTFDAGPLEPALGLGSTIGFPQIEFFQNTINIMNLAVGFKVNPVADLLLTFNMTFQLNDEGLRDRATPLLVMSYTF